MCNYKGIALDIGSTNIVAALITGGNCADITATHVNAQAAISPELIGRINAADGDYGRLREALLFSVNNAVSAICDVANISPTSMPTVAVGNTVMSAFFAGLPVASLGRSPFTPPSLFGEEQAVEGYVGGSAYIAPAFGGFVGGDVAAGVFAHAANEDGVLFIDVGTNGEVYGCYKGKRLVCSAAAGPALEKARGAGTSHLAVSARRSGGRLSVATADGSTPAGLAGSAVAELVALMIGNECDEMGKITGGAVNLEGGITFTDKDMTEFQLAKAAIAAATLCVMRGLRMPPAAIKKLYIAGAMGSGTDPQALIKTGLVPSYAAGKLQFLGNSALKGSYMLFEEDAKAKIKAFCKDTAVLPLEKSEYFKERFAEELFFYE